MPYRAVRFIIQGGCPASVRYTVTMLYFRYSITETDHMALSTADRQRIYRDKISRGEIKRFQFALPLETGIKVDYLCNALQCNKTELFARLILKEWKREGEPVPD